MTRRTVLSLPLGWAGGLRRRLHCWNWFPEAPGTGSRLGSPAEEDAHLVRPFQFGACMRRARRKRTRSPGARSNHHTPHTTHTTPRSKWLLPCPLDVSGWLVLGPNICRLVYTDQRVPPFLVSVWMHSALVSSWPKKLFPWQTPMWFSAYLMLLTALALPFTSFGGVLGKL